MYESNDKMVSHPDHYESNKGLKVIDVIEAFTEPLYGIEATDTANLIKYSCRWHKKNGIQDLEKIMWYAQHLIDHLKEKTTVIENESSCLSAKDESNPVNIAPSFNRDTTVIKYFDRITGSEIINPSYEELERGVASTREFVYDIHGNLVNVIHGMSKNAPLNLKL